MNLSTLPHVILYLNILSGTHTDRTADSFLASLHVLTESLHMWSTISNMAMLRNELYVLQHGDPNLTQVKDALAMQQNERVTHTNL